MDLEALIEAAKERIGAIIQRPKMSEKLLSKPPFRFLHDVITAVTNATGFAEGLYTPEELDSGSITDKGAKIAYLEKIFTCVGICKGQELDVRAAKVVAGLEPEHTCMFLVALAECATDASYDSAQAVRRTLDGEQAGSGPPARTGGGGSDAKSEAKSAVSAKDTRDDEVPHHRDESKGFESKHQEVDIPAPVAAERGKSRGGTRAGRPSQQQSAAGAGLMAPDRPASLDREIDQCDGGMETTKETLGNLITKPKLSEKLLSKPPFRFLHDIVTEVIRVTGFASTLFAADELDSSNIKEKEQKIAFLEKIIRLVGVQLNTIIEAKPAKIVAGLEAQDTNRFLQLLALAAQRMPDSTVAAKVVLEQMGVDVPAAPGGHEENRFEEKHEPEPVRRQHVEQEAPLPARAEEKSKPLRAMEQPHMRQDSHDDRKGGVEDDRPMDDTTTDAGDKGNDGDIGSDNKRSMRPTTARRRPPKIKEAAVEVTAKDTAPVAAKKVEGIMIDGQADEDEIEENLMGDESRLADAKDGADDERNQQSKLVQDILSRQAEQEAARGDAKQEKPTDAKDSGPGKTGGIRLGKLRKTGTDKEKKAGAVNLGAGDIDRLRKAVQSLVQHTGPLGSCMDYVQEDVSIMATELHRWEEECRKYEAELEVQKRTTSDILGPLERQLNEIEEEIKEEQLKITATKASIAKNESRIQQILRLVATA